MSELDQCNVFVKYLPSHLDDDGLYHLFADFGEIVSSKVMIDHQSGSSLGYGFVRFVDPEDAQQAISSMTGQRIANKILLCKLSNTSPSTVAPEPSNNLYIKPLLASTTEDNLRELFDKYGPIDTCKVMVDKTTGQSRQIGFVRFEHQKDATVALEEMNGKKLDEDEPPLVVKYAETENQRTARKARSQWLKSGSGRSSPERPPSPNYFNFSALQSALYSVPYMKGAFMGYVPVGYSPYMMPVTHPHHSVNPLWRPNYCSGDA